MPQPNPVTNRKGIILAGGAGTRLYPLTLGTSKQLLPVYDKPMIYYPLSVLMLAGIKEILVISTPEDIDNFRRLLGDGHKWGLQLGYQVQPRPEGLAQAFLLAEEFLDNSPSCLILGDNIFYGQQLTESLKAAHQNIEGATVFGHYVQDPQRYGVAQLNPHGKLEAIIEKPQTPPSNYAITGIYFYDNDVVAKAKTLQPSPRGELEITDLNNLYLKEQKLHLKILGRGSAWLDTGTHESLVEATEFIRAVELRQGLKVCCPEEIAWRQGYIDTDALTKLATALGKSPYGKYLNQLASSHKYGWDIYSA